MEENTKFDTFSEEEKEKNIVGWFESDLLPKLLKEGRFKLPFIDNYENITWKITWECSTRNTDHFASCPYFAQLTLHQNSLLIGHLNVVIKFSIQDLSFRQIMSTDSQFYNEMIMYNQVFGVFQDYLKSKQLPDYLNELVPKSYYANIDLDEPEKAIVILEDLRVKGYKTCPSKAFIDHNHVQHSLLQLARFHAISYALKLEKNENFNQFKTVLREVRYEDDNYKKQSTNIFFKICATRGLKYLKSHPGIVSEQFIENVEKHLSDDVYSLLGELVQPYDESLSVVCHGDFCRNNILYKYAHDQVFNAKLFDFQASRYGTPAVDLVFFFYLNTNEEQRDKYFEDYLKIYHNEIIRSVAEITKQSENVIRPQLLTLSSIKDNFGKLSIYGYVIIAFFLPQMLDKNKKKTSLVEDFKTKTTHEMAMECLDQGGDEATKRVADVLIHMYKNGFYST